MSESFNCRFFLEAREAIRAIPLSFGKNSYSQTFKMKPFNGAVVIVTSNHVSK